MENNKAEAIRAARRKARILNNSEGRINRILGQSTNDDKNNDDGNTNKISNSENILQASTNDILRNSNPTQQLPTPTSQEKCLQAPLTNNCTSTTDHPKIKSEASSNSSTIKVPKTSEVLLQDANAKAGTNYQGLGIILWIMFGVVTRIVLDTNVSWITRNSALVPFLITYIAVCFVKKHRASTSVNSSNDTSNFTIIEVALRLCGLPAHTIKLLMSIKKTSEAFVKTFSLFFIPFVMTHALISVVESYGFSEESDNQ